MTPAEAKLLLWYNAWANRRLFQGALSLRRHFVEQDLSSSHTSVWGTMLHIAWAEWLWLGRWQRSPAPRGGAADSRAMADLEARWAEITRQQLAFVDGLGAADLDQLVSYENPAGTTWTYPLGEMVRHTVNHSTYHRGQVASMLRQLGVTPPATDYLIYFDEGTPPPPPSR